MPPEMKICQTRAQYVKLIHRHKFFVSVQALSSIQSIPKLINVTVQGLAVFNILHYDLGIQNFYPFYDIAENLILGVRFVS